MTVALVDGDIVAYRSAASAEKEEDASIALIRASRTLQDIVSVTGADECKVYLSGSRNWRKELYPEYKANRINMPRPKYLQPVREFLVLEWGAEVTDGYEADDALGVAMGERDGGVCCSIDKDLLQLPGLHYNFVTESFREIDFYEGWRNFYRQLVLGDKGDNVPGFDGKMRIKFPKFLSHIQDELGRSTEVAEMANLVRDLYKKVGSTEEIFLRNGRLLHIWREMDDEWTPPQMPAEITSEAKQGEAPNSESTPTTQEVTSQSTERGGTKRKRGGSRRRGRQKDTAKAKKRRAA